MLERPWEMSCAGHWAACENAGGTVTEIERWGSTALPMMEAAGEVSEKKGRRQPGGQLQVPRSGDRAQGRTHARQVLFTEGSAPPSI